MEQSNGMIIVISGYSGVGKSTVIKYMFAKMPKLKFSISCTSRKPRNGEVDGVNYYFIDEQEFEKRIADGEFVEYTRTFTNYYGTPKTEIKNALEQGYDLLLDINSVGAKHIKEYYPKCLTIFINPPSLEVLKQRLIGRGSESEESLKRRLDEIDFESKAIPFYDFVITNEIASKCADDIVEFIERERAKSQAED